MAAFFKKKFVIGIVTALFLVTLAGCSGTHKKPNVNTTSGGVKTTDSNKGNSNSENTNNNKGDDSNSTGNEGIVKSDGGKSSTDSKYKAQKPLLEDIMKKAKAGAVINSGYAAKSSNLADIEEKWGKADSSDWVAKAKGIYAVYSKHNVVFGVNKGEQVFEVRSLDKGLNKITMDGVKQYLGKPAHDVKANDEEILGYTVSKDFKILFVFSEQKNGEAVLKHYSILYPQGTVNYMSGDMGREW